VLIVCSWSIALLRQFQQHIRCLVISIHPNGSAKRKRFLHRVHFVANLPGPHDLLIPIHVFSRNARCVHREKQRHSLARRLVSSREMRAGSVAVSPPAIHRRRQRFGVGYRANSTWQKKSSFSADEFPKTDNRPATRRPAIVRRFRDGRSPGSCDTCSKKPSPHFIPNPPTSHICAMQRRFVQKILISDHAWFRNSANRRMSATTVSVSSCPCWQFFRFASHDWPSSMGLG